MGALDGVLLPKIFNLISGRASFEEIANEQQIPSNLICKLLATTMRCSKIKVEMSFPQNHILFHSFRAKTDFHALNYVARDLN